MFRTARVSSVPLGMSTFTALRSVTPGTAGGRSGRRQGGKEGSGGGDLLGEHIGRFG